MQLNTSEQKILSILHSLPAETQQEVLNFSLFLKTNMHRQRQDR